MFGWSMGWTHALWMDAPTPLRAPELLQKHGTRPQGLVQRLRVLVQAPVLLPSLWLPALVPELAPPALPPAPVLPR